MKKLELANLIISILAVIIALASIIISYNFSEKANINADIANQIAKEANEIAKDSIKIDGRFEVDAKTSSGNGETVTYFMKIYFENLSSKKITLEEIGYKNLDTGELYDINMFMQPVEFSWTIEAGENLDKKVEDISNFPKKMIIQSNQNDLTLDISNYQFYVKDIYNNYYYDKYYCGGEYRDRIYTGKMVISGNGIFD